MLDLESKLRMDGGGAPVGMDGDGDGGSSDPPSRSLCSVNSRHGALAWHKAAPVGRVPLDRALAAGRGRAHAGCSIGAPVVRTEPGVMGHDALVDDALPFLGGGIQAAHDASPNDKSRHDSADDDDGGDQFDPLGCCRNEPRVLWGPRTWLSLATVLVLVLGWVSGVCEQRTFCGLRVSWGSHEMATESREVDQWGQPGEAEHKSLGWT